MNSSAPGETPPSARGATVRSPSGCNRPLHTDPSRRPKRNVHRKQTEETPLCYRKRTPPRRVGITPAAPRQRERRLLHVWLSWPGLDQQCFADIEFQREGTRCGHVRVEPHRDLERAQLSAVRRCRLVRLCTQVCGLRLTAFEMVQGRSVNDSQWL